MPKTIGMAGHVGNPGSALQLALERIRELPSVGPVSFAVPSKRSKRLTVLLYCIAADRPKLPKAEEFDRLPTHRLVVAITRSDLVEDAELGRLTEDIVLRLAESRFPEAAVVPFSASTGEGFDALRYELDQACLRPRKSQSSDPKEIIELVGNDPNGVTTSAICKRLGVNAQQLGDVFESLLETDQLLGFAGLWMSHKAYEDGAAQFLAALHDFHSRKPTAPGHPIESVLKRAKLNWSGKALDRILAKGAADALWLQSGDQVRARDFVVTLTARQRDLLDRVKVALELNPIEVPYLSDLAKLVPAPIQAVREILKLGIDSREIVRVADEIYYTKSQLDGVYNLVKASVGTRPFSPARMREALGVSRRYANPLLEYFDARGWTRRVGLNRVLARK